jgi:hypothetical protein
MSTYELHGHNYRQVGIVEQEPDGAPVADVEMDSGQDAKHVCVGGCPAGHTHVVAAVRIGDLYNAVFGAPARSRAESGSKSCVCLFSCRRRCPGVDFQFVQTSQGLIPIVVG